MTSGVFISFTMLPVSSYCQVWPFRRVPRYSAGSSPLFSSNLLIPEVVRKRSVHPRGTGAPHRDQIMPMLVRDEKGCSCRFMRFQLAEACRCGLSLVVFIARRRLHCYISGPHFSLGAVEEIRPTNDNSRAVFE